MIHKKQFNFNYIYVFVSILFCVMVGCQRQASKKVLTPFPLEIKTITTRPAICFAPDTPREKMDQHAINQLANHFPVIGPFQFEDADRWTTTATNGASLQQGDPTVITWSIVPDGTGIGGFADESNSDSNLVAFLDGLYGGAAQTDIALKPWFSIIQSVFDRWGALTGNIYIYEANDDGSNFKKVGPFKVQLPDGQLGVRGDVRISGHYIDGNSGILAYNFFPNLSDMVIDTGDNFFNDLASNSLKLRNVISHEHGHGLGFSHVCPVNQTKLMEPYASTAFDGPQQDDIQAAQRGYGDLYESNDTVNDAIDLGVLVNNVTVSLFDISIDGTSDDDYFSVQVPVNTDLSVTVTPIGQNYLNGEQNSDGSCATGTSFNAQLQSDLSFEIIAPDTTTVVASANNGGVGVAEMVTNLSVSNNGGQYYIHITGGSDLIQLYDLQIVATTPCLLPVILNDPNDVNVCLNNSINLSVIAIGDTLTYQWQKGGVDLIGETNQTLSIVQASIDNGGEYRVVVTNCAGSVVSSSATLIVNAVVGDFDFNCDVDVLDFKILIANWLEDCTQTDCQNTDLSNDDFIDLRDFEMLNSALGL